MAQSTRGSSSSRRLRLLRGSTPARASASVVMLLLLLGPLLLGPATVDAWRPAPHTPQQQPPRRQSSSPPRSWLPQPVLKAMLLAGVLCLPSAARAFPGLEDCVSESNPSFTVVTCDKHFGIENGRPKRCQASENCISTTSVQSASKYASPWVYNTDDVNAAFLQLVKAVENEGSLKIVEIDNERHYLRAEGPSKVPPGSTDDVEFLLTPKEEDSLVFFRTGSRQSVFVYPVQQPLPDGGTLKKRLDTIQKSLRWDSVADLYQY